MTDPAPTRRFSDRAGDYVRSRPSYPPAAIDAILNGLVPPEALAVADVAAGTGIATHLLADRGARVAAVEPNAAMRGAARPHPRITWHAGTAEATGLAAGAHDLVTVAQAFHWFDASAALCEFQRLLRPGGRLAIFWNRRNRDDAFTAGYCRALEAIDGEAPAERSTFDATSVAATGRFAGLRTLVFPNTQALSLDDLIARALSTSTVPRAGPRTDELLRLLRLLHAQHRDRDGRATMVYRTEVHLWHRAGQDCEPDGFSALNNGSSQPRNDVPNAGICADTIVSAGTSENVSTLVTNERSHVTCPGVPLASTLSTTLRFIDVMTVVNAVSTPTLTTRNAPRNSCCGWNG